MSSEDPSIRTAFVHNLPEGTEQSDVEKWFRDFVVERIIVKPTKKLPNGKQRQCAFITFVSNEEVKRAIATLHHMEVRAQSNSTSAIQVQLADKTNKPPPPSDGRSLNTIFIPKLPFGTTAHDVRRYFVEFGPILDVRVVKQEQRNKSMTTFGFVEFAQAENARKAFDISNGKSVFGGDPLFLKLQASATRNVNMLQYYDKKTAMTEPREPRLTVQRPEPEATVEPALEPRPEYKTVIVKNVSKLINSVDMDEIFSQFGAIQKVEVSRDEVGNSTFTITFDTCEAAGRAMAVDGHIVECIDSNDKSKVVLSVTSPYFETKLEKSRNVTLCIVSELPLTTTEAMKLKVDASAHKCGRFEFDRISSTSVFIDFQHGSHAKKFMETMRSKQASYSPMAVRWGLLTHPYPFRSEKNMATSVTTLIETHRRSGDDSSSDGEFEAAPLEPHQLPEDAKDEPTRPLRSSSEPLQDEPPSSAPAASSLPNSKETFNARQDTRPRDWDRSSGPATSTRDRTERDRERERERERDRERDREKDRVRGGRDSGRDLRYSSGPPQPPVNRTKTYPPRASPPRGWDRPPAARPEGREGSGPWTDGPPNTPQYSYSRSGTGYARNRERDGRDPRDREARDPRDRDTPRDRDALRDRDRDIPRDTPRDRDAPRDRDRDAPRDRDREWGWDGRDGRGRDRDYGWSRETDRRRWEGGRDTR